MADPLIVSISALRIALLRALDAAEAELGTEITLETDYYWHIQVQDAFDMAHSPETFTVGQVSDDLAQVELADHERVPAEAWHDLSHLIGILRALELAATS